MKRYILLITTTILASYGFAQSIERSVLASSGNFTSTSTLSISSTIGEVFVTTLSTSSMDLTQGFQQSSSGGGNPGPGSVEDLNDFNFSVYPNPFQDEVNIKSGKIGNYSVAVFDLLGRNLNVDFTNSSSNKLDVKLNLRNYQSGLYFLKIYDDSSHLKTIKIKKQ